MSLLRAPLIALRWLAVLAGVLAWLLVVPIVDLVRSLVRRVRRA